MPAACAAATASVIGRMRPHEMIDGRARRRLAAFVEPESGDHPRIIRSPDARDEAGLGRRRHDAGRGPHDVGETAADIDRLARLLAASDRADASGMRVDQRSADRRALEQAEFERRGFASGRRPAACPARRSRCRFWRSHRRRDRQGRCARNSCRSSALHARENSICRRACRSNAPSSRWRGTKGSRRDRGNGRPTDRLTADAASATAVSEFPFRARSSRRHSAARRPASR